MDGFIVSQPANGGSSGGYRAVKISTTITVRSNGTFSKEAITMEHPIMVVNCYYNWGCEIAATYYYENSDPVWASPDTGGSVSGINYTTVLRSPRQYNSKEYGAIGTFAFYLQIDKNVLRFHFISTNWTGITDSTETTFTSIIFT